MEGGGDLKRTEARAMEGGEDLKKTEGIVRLADLVVKKRTAEVGSKEEPQPAGAGAGKRRKKLVKKRLNKELLDHLMKHPIPPVPPLSDKIKNEKLRAYQAFCESTYKEISEFEAELIEQYKAKGYAEIHAWVVDDEVQN